MSKGNREVVEERWRRHHLPGRLNGAEDRAVAAACLRSLADALTEPDTREEERLTLPGRYGIVGGVE